MLYLRNQPVDIARYLPAFLQSDKRFQSLLQACSTEHEKYRLFLDELSNQFYVETATWGLSDWERILALKPAPSDSYEQRRNRILLYLQSRQTSTVEFLSRLSSRYVYGGSAKIVERNEQNAFYVRIDGDMKGLRVDRHGMHEGLDLYKPAHLAYSIVVFPERRIFLNRAGPVQIRTIPAKTWTTQEPYTVFRHGLNAAGPIEIAEHTVTTTTQHKAYQFKGSTLNGGIHLNGGGKYSVGEYDAGRDVTESWQIFSFAELPTLNGRLRLNAAPKTTRSRTYHVADWRSRITQRSDTLNHGGGAWKTWSTSSSKTTQERRFRLPFYTLNKCGTKTTTREDVGYDTEITETLFSGARLNGSPSQKKSTTVTDTQTQTYRVFIGGRLNGSGQRLMLNSAASQTRSMTRKTSKTTVRGLFSRNLLCGKLKFNDCQHESVTRTVHVPVWRDVVHRHGAALLNDAQHETHSKTITHTVPSRQEKYFDPKHGTLLNSHAVLGYMTL